MAMSWEELKRLVQLVGRTEEREIDCDECLKKVSEFAEEQLMHKPLSEALRAVEQHLAICGECREEYEMLRKAISTLGPDGN